MKSVGLPWKQLEKAERFDAIVIGSGLGSLTTAMLLARHAGKRVLVLERHYVAGGFTHVFHRPGYEWDVGVHYIGDVQNPKAMTRRIFDHVSGGRLQWASMGDVYDRIVMGGEHYDFHSGARPFVEELARRFPGQEATIERYVGVVREASRTITGWAGEKAVPGPVAALGGGLMRRAFLKHARRTTGEVMKELTPDPLLTGVLTGQWGDYGLPPSRSSFGMHAVLARHYLWGGSYPVGGAAAIAATIAPGIEQAGGRIAVSAEVDKVLMEGGRAAGVRMADGTELRAPLVVSGAGVHNTFLKLLPAETAQAHGLLAKAQAIPPSLSHLALYVGVKATAEELGLPRHNLWVYPGPDHDANLEAFLRDPDNALPLAYISFPSAKDPDFQRRCPGRATVEVVTVAPYAAFARWENGRWHRRGADYDARKQVLAQRLQEVLEQQVPALRGRIDHAELSTPLSTRHFANYAQGEIYGLEHSPQRFQERWLKPRTPISGFYLTGQDLVTCGLGGALISGVLTASAILGRNLMSRATRGVEG